MANGFASSASTALLSLLLAACGGSGSAGVQRVATSSGADSHSSPAWQPSPPARGEVIYPGVGVRFTPTNEPASVTSAQARVVAERAPYAGIAIGAPVVQLARVTDDDFPPGSGPTLHHDENVLGWVLKYNSRRQDFGGSASPPMAGGCDLVIIVDATTAALLDGFQTCPAL